MVEGDEVHIELPVFSVQLCRPANLKYFLLPKPFEG
jgi:hypothetical protein